MLVEETCKGMVKNYVFRKQSECNSMVEAMVWDHRVVGSSPATLTKYMLPWSKGLGLKTFNLQIRVQFPSGVELADGVTGNTSGFDPEDLGGSNPSLPAKLK